MGEACSTDGEEENV